MPKQKARPDESERAFDSRPAANFSFPTIAAMRGDDGDEFVSFIDEQ